ncbi:MAG: helix-turn-helix domain-containing protein [Oscillospiraceae bacterium]|nr:helix-turn-helix domain-containing protein [Oscillospiraceae bacterium]
MDCGKVGGVIRALRKEKGMTQKALADAVNISDRTVSKWERGLGCPDVSLLAPLSDALNVNIEKILSGDIKPEQAKGGNMKNIKFYCCPVCGNVLAAAAEVQACCCGRKCAPLKAAAADKDHAAEIEEIEDDFYITVRHPMEKTHYLTFAAYVSWDSVLLIKLYPEQQAEVRFPKMRGGDLYLCCSEHGLMKYGRLKTR